MHFFGEKFVEKNLIICKICQIREYGNDRDVPFKNLKLHNLDANLHTFEPQYERERHKNRGIAVISARALILFSTI